jgi:hypothetical protein
MDLGIIGAVALIVVWAVATFATEAPGWVHLLLTAGVFLLILRIVQRGTPAAKADREAERTGKTSSRR